MSTLVFNPQRLLGSLATAKVENNPVQMITRMVSDPSRIVQKAPVAALEAPATKPAAWDPHEVWLSRVKVPREQRTL